MHVGGNNPEYNYTMRGVKLGKTDEEKDIGVTITKNLKPSVQCEKAAGRATSVLNQIRRNFHYRDRHNFVRLYKQYVRPHLEFASPSWSLFGNCSSQLPHLIEELPQWPSGPSLVTPAAESHRIPKPDQTVFYELQFIQL